jgi:predicted nucleotide-binding protein (sugar kinase/HSP70/actin superfamily)
MDKIISFPHMGNYHVPIKYLLTHLTDYKVRVAPPITKKTLELGTKHSPDFVCIPFKYNLGNYIEALENGANVLIQAGGGCRYGYYAEVQQQILKDLGYNFEFYSLVGEDEIAIISMYKMFKKINEKLSLFKYLYYALLTLLMINYMDKLDIYVRENIGFEVIPNSFESTLKQMHIELSKTKGFIHLIKLYRKYKKLLKSIETNKPKNCLKVGIIGELYTCMEPFSNYFIEKTLAKMNIQIRRRTDVTYLIVTKRFNTKKLLKICKNYCKYTIGADGMDNVAEAKMLAEKGYDGLIHTKPFGCTPEIGAVSILQKLSADYKIPIIYLTFDSHTSEEGIKTRLEAFYDMIEMRRKNSE